MGRLRIWRWSRACCAWVQLGKPAEDPKLLLQAKIRTTQGYLLNLQPSARVTLLAAHDIRRGRAQALLFFPEGKPRSLELEALGTPQLDGMELVYQRDETTVVRLDLTTGAERELALTANCGASKAAGQVIAGAGRTFYVPESAELLVDLDRGVDLDRKLRAIELPVREMAVRWRHKFNESGRKNGLVFALAWVRVDRRAGYSLNYISLSGDGAPAAQKVIKDAYRAFDLPAYTAPAPFRRSSSGCRSFGGLAP
jgi:hypothetical protein